MDRNRGDLRESLSGFHGPSRSEGVCVWKYIPSYTSVNTFSPAVVPVYMWATRERSVAKRKRCPHIHRQPPRTLHAACDSSAPDAVIAHLGSSTLTDSKDSILHFAFSATSSRNSLFLPVFACFAGLVGFLLKNSIVYQKVAGRSPQVSNYDLRESLSGFHGPSRSEGMCMWKYRPSYTPVNTLSC